MPETVLYRIQIDGEEFQIGSDQECLDLSKDLKIIAAACDDNGDIERAEALRGIGDHLMVEWQAAKCGRLPLQNVQTIQ